MCWNNEVANKRERRVGCIAVGLAVVGMVVCLLLAAQVSGIRWAMEHNTNEQRFNVQYISDWCGGTEGRIYMVGAHKYEQNGTMVTLEDEHGNLWDIDGVAVEDTDFLLLWLDDKGTTENIDDVIIKVWRDTVQQ